MTDRPSLRPEFRFGEGKISAVLSGTLGLLALGAVLCLHFPELLTTPEARAVYPMGLVRATIQAVLVLAFVFGALAAVLAARIGRLRGLVGLGASTLAALLGGADVPVEGPVRSTHYLGLDWFVLNLFVLALIFVPMERLFVRLPRQRVFRRGFRTDLVYFGVSHLLVQVSVFLSMMPAKVLFGWATWPALQQAVSSQPVVVQFVEAMFVADFFGYWSHRAFHRVPFLWRFHQIHHSSQELDWLAGSRLHLVDIVVTRALGFLPLHLLGFSPAATYGDLTFVSFHAVFIHANVRFALNPLRSILVTPKYHHFHHAAEPEAVDKNFAVHLPIIDLVFGTFFCPSERWPRAYGIEGNPVPDGYLRQTLYPLRGTNELHEGVPSA
jgi:lathosterol oxidase